MLGWEIGLTRSSFQKLIATWCTYIVSNMITKVIILMNFFFIRKMTIRYRPG